MFTIKLYTFAKDSNSTKQPTGGTSYSCNILTPADITAPVVEISATDLTSVNYAYIASFHRYYFIVGTEYNAGIWRLKLKCDVLATYKSTIGAASLYITRASAAYDGNIQDNLYPKTASVTKRHAQQAISDDIPGYVIPQGESEYRNLGYEGGYIILNIAGVNTAGASTLILMTTSDFRDLVSVLYNSINGYQLGDVIKKVVQNFGGNPQELINGALWVPAWSFVGDNMDVVHIGAWDAEYQEVNPDYDPTDPDSPYYITHYIYGLYLDSPGTTAKTVSFTIQKHPQAASRGQYLNLAPYTAYTLGIPGCGVITLDSSKLLNETTINIYRTIDAFSGQLSVDVVAASSGQIIAHLTGQAGIPIFLRGSNNATNVAGSIGTTVGSALTGNVAGMIGGAIGSISEIVGGSPTSAGMGAGFAEAFFQRSGLSLYCDSLSVKPALNFISMGCCL